MTTRPKSVATAQSRASDGRQQSTATASAEQIEIALLECRVAALQRELKAERERRQAVVSRYERLLDER